MRFFTRTLLVATACLTFACADDEKETIEEQSVFHIAADVDLNDEAEVQMAPATVLNEGSFSVVENGTQMEGTRSAYLAEANGLIYNLNYGTGVIRELEYDGANSYKLLSEVDASVKLGTYPRFEVVGDNEESLMAFYVTTTKSDDETTATASLQLVDYDLPGLNYRKDVNIDLGTYNTGEFYVSRVDAPVILDGKVYIGTSQSKVGGTRSDYPTDIKTIVLDYPSLDNVEIISSSASEGQTYGYRGRSMYVYNEAVYQINWAVNDADVVITRLKDSAYDNSYVLNISEALGGGTYGSVNWFHIGNGKGYAAIEDKSIEDDNNWFLVYIDLEAKSVQKIEGVPMSDMFAYQNAVVTGGSTFNIAISPVGQDAFIWQINGATATKGAQLDGGNVWVQGIY